MLPYITIGNVTIDMYTSMIGVAAMGMLLYLLSRRKKARLSVLQSVIFVLIFTVCGVLEVALLGFLETGSFGELEMFGAVYLIPLIMPVLGKLFVLSSQQTLDISAICIAITGACIKIGCFFAGCCEGVVLYVGRGYFQWPAQIIGSIAGFFLVLWLVHVEASEKKQGALYPLFMLSYGIVRFVLDSMEYMPDRWLGLRHSQCFALASAVIGFVWFGIYKKRINQK